MSNEEEFQHFYNCLYKEIYSEFEHIKDKNIYSTQMPNKIQLVEGEKEALKYGHPIRWMLAGYAGIHAFIIGSINIFDEVEDDFSEQNYYPPILTQTLASLGSEYVYSQISIVLIDENVTEQTLNWLNKWRDDPRYFRKVLVPISINSDIKQIAMRLVENILFPWNSIKSSPLSNLDIIDIFNNEEEEEEEDE